MRSSAGAAGPSRVAWTVLLVGVVLFVGLALWLVPWNVVPGGDLDVPSAGEVFTPNQVHRATSYASGSRWLSRTALVVSVAVALLLGFTRAGRWVTGRLRGPWPVRVVSATTLVVMIGRVATLPLDIWFWQRERDYGLSVQGWGGWLRDELVGLLVAVVIASVALLVLLSCVRRWPRAWPAVAGGVLAALVALGSFVYPIAVEPLFNHFQPLQAGSLRTEVLDLAEREGVEVDDVLVADASRRTTTINAYVTGFGGTRRVVLYDTLIDDTDRGELLAVVAHELAHAKHDDVMIGTALGAAGSLVAAGLLGLIAARRRDGLRGPTAVPALLALFAVASVLVTPLENAISRQLETRADIDALHATGERGSFVRLQRQLAVRSLADPEPAAWSQWWFGSHPTALQRIAIARRILP